MIRVGWLCPLIVALLSACSKDAVTQAKEEAVQASPEPVTVPVETGGIDPASGLIIDEHWELVKAHCSACHSPQLVTQNRGSRQNWLEMIRWMQDTQGLWPFDEATETALLDYLEKNYAPSASYRRAPLPRALLPENPYSGSEGWAL